MNSRDKLNRFEQQVSPHLGSAYNLAKWLTRNHEDAEDVVQEAFLRAFAALDNLREPDAKAWLLTIVRNTCYTWLQRNRKVVNSLEEQRTDPPEPSPDPEELILIAANRNQVTMALEQLPTEFREAIVLREFEGYSYKEIAEVSGVRLGTVMSRLSRGRDWLRRALSTSKKEVA